MAQESKLQIRITKKLKKSGWLVTKIMLCSTPGWPDIYAIRNKRSIHLEIKSKGKKAEPLQEYVHYQIKKQSGEVYLIDTWEKFLALKLD
jgi:hypothetical protein